MKLITQPFGSLRLGDFLLNHFADPQWTVFRAAVAFVKRSGMQFLRQPLLDFNSRAQSRISVGVDHLGTSTEGLSDLLDATSAGQVFVYHNNGPYTFHPKVYLFKSAKHADLLVGSGNLTSGGLFTNYETSLAISLDLSVSEDEAFRALVETEFDRWSRLQEGLCYPLTPELIEQLIASGLVRSEAELSELQRTLKAAHRPTESADSENGESQPIKSLFASVRVPDPPQMPGVEVAAIEMKTLLEMGERSRSPIITPSDITPLPIQGLGNFVMTLQNTDVGVGQITKGTSRRSPEVFIPLKALDENPAFWTFPDQFTPDVNWNNTHPNRRNGLGKLDRMNVPMRIGVVQSVRMFFNPRKGDFRLGNETLRSSGNIGDMLLVRRVDPVNGFEYDIQVAPQGSPLFMQLSPFCNTDVPNSPKKYGYF